jgi:hypothetical protein
MASKNGFCISKQKLQEIKSMTINFFKFDENELTFFVKFASFEVEISKSGGHN